MGYRSLHAAGTEVELSALNAEVQKHYTSHRRVFDTGTGQLRQLGGSVLTEREALFVERAKQRVVLGEARKDAKAKAEREIDLAIRRKRAKARPAEKRKKDNEATKARVELKRPLKKPRAADVPST